MKQKILVTGGSGFIGSHMVRELIKRNYEVAITTKYDSVYENIRLYNLWKKIKVIECDLRHSNSINKIKDFNPKIIIHFAAYNDVKGSFLNYNEALESNTIGTANLLENFKSYDQFVYISTSEVYGYQKRGLLFHEKLLPHPISPYSIGKYTGELYAQMHMQHMRKPIKILRPFNVFGETQSNKAVIPELIEKFIKNETVKITKGLQTREFNYVGNTVNFLYQALNRNSFFNNIVNISDGNEISIKALAKKIQELTNSKSKLIIGGLTERPTEIHKMKASVKKMKGLLSKNSKLISFEEGLIRTINWHKEKEKLSKIF
ncbi:NAD-dependent epimerase/dehydratase family protein [Candidatus Pelagibacter sp.]|uniref:NAD-dependent epimerase/dehydratase family protein n=1 Tax=Candidatus Pelagibacter sp. TaxID=2024849 RepID=UPI003F867969